MPVITISSSFGSFGALIGRQVATELGLSFFDRAIPVAVAHQLAVDADEVLEYDERPPKRIDRMLAAFAAAVVPLGSEHATTLVDSPKRVREGTEAVLRAIADGDGGVVLGRAGMYVLRDRADVLRVRLDGPVQLRIAQVLATEETDLETATAQQRETDGAREAYAQIFYGVSQTDPSLYHLMLDSADLSPELCTEIIVKAAREHLGLSSTF